MGDCFIVWLIQSCMLRIQLLLKKKILTNAFVVGLFIFEMFKGLIFADVV